MKIHIVQKGDTLWKIAKKYGVDFEELKSMNTQLSNPDLIMPGMKIKVPSGNVALKKEAPVKKEMPIKKEMPKVEHPFAKEKPKEAVDVEDTAPKDVKTEKPSKPYIPPVPNIQHPVYTGIDMNNYYTVNMAMMPQMPNPQLPPKPENVLPDIMKDDEDIYKVPAKELPKDLPKEQPKEQFKEQPYYTSPLQQEEDSKDMANMPNLPNMPYMPMPTNVAPAMYQPHCVAPQYMVPVSPVLPGSGLCPPGPYFPMPYGFGPAMPQQPYPTAVSPAEYDDDDDEQGPYAPNMPYPQAVAPAAHYGHGFPVNPYAGVPVSPVLPGPGFHHPSQVLGAYDDPYDDDDYENEALSPAYDQKDCGCGGPAPQMSPYQQMPQYGYPMQQPYGGFAMMHPVGYPMQQPFGGYQGQQFMGPQPQGQQFMGDQGQQFMSAQGQQFMSPQGFSPEQMAQGGQMFEMPDYDSREDNDED
ncbi:SafA/ExsA family spore coat assembly protein [uncultured Metabacillus sp.]|uniref:SafA/ExsA family spore coat assembly protein n=1 Tax=uncultured Metabacillus sp. TaxID=2860135 RepID=UPI00261348C1|nr:SafA/ExsA family spore coat assembly protein [uncultured Metabacillus sp.]